MIEVKDDKGRVIGKWVRHTTTPAYIFEPVSYVPVTRFSKEDIDKALIKLEALKRPCECGAEMKFVSFPKVKMESVPLSNSNREKYIGKYQCTACKKRFYITEDQLK